MKKTVFTALGAAVLFSASYISYRQVFNSQESDLFMANVEALSNNEDVKYLNCTEAISSKSCYQTYEHGDMWACEVVTAVREYQVAVGSPIICHHDKVSDCPEGTFEK